MFLVKQKIPCQPLLSFLSLVFCFVCHVLWKDWELILICLSIPQPPSVGSVLAVQPGTAQRMVTPTTGTSVTLATVRTWAWTPLNNTAQCQEFDHRQACLQPHMFVHSWICTSAWDISWMQEKVLYFFPNLLSVQQVTRVTSEHKVFSVLLFCFYFLLEKHLRVP